MQIEELSQGLSEMVRAVMNGKKAAFTFSVPVAEVERCVWCEESVVSGRLSDGEVVDFDLEADGNEWRIEFSRPHRCAPMIAAERSDDPEELLRRDVEQFLAGLDDERRMRLERDDPDEETSSPDLAVVEDGEQDVVKTRKIPPAAAALRARFLEGR